jgi:hypothetical protein
MVEFSVGPEFLLILVAGLLALLFDYFPGIAKWFDGLDIAAKRQLNAGLVIGAMIIIFAGQCIGWFATNLVCTVRGSFDALYIVFLAIGVNQGVHALLKPTEKLKARMRITAK